MGFNSGFKGLTTTCENFTRYFRVINSQRFKRVGHIARVEKDEKFFEVFVT